MLNRHINILWPNEFEILKQVKQYETETLSEESHHLAVAPLSSGPSASTSGKCGVALGWSGYMIFVPSARVTSH